MAPSSLEEPLRVTLEPLATTEPLEHEIVDRGCNSLKILSVTGNQVALRDQAIDLGASDFQWNAT